MKYLFNLSVLITILLISVPMAVAQDESEQVEQQSDEQRVNFDECVLQRIEVVNDDTPIKEIKKHCEKNSSLAIYRPSKEVLYTESEDSEGNVAGSDEEKQKGSTLLKKRLRMEYRVRDNRFAIIPHKPNYLLPVTFNNTPNQDSLENSNDERQVDNIEVKFQVSFKTPFWEQPFGDDSALFFAYTGQSYWQAYNSDVSSPFRETNHEPEIFAAWATDWELGGWQVPYFSAGISHQSNGRSGTDSRSWNRIYTEFAFERDRWVIAFKPWWRIPEDRKTDPLDPDGDDNPDIDDYMGYFELYSAYQWDEHNFGILLRNNLRSDNRGAIQFDWTFPLDDDGKLRGYVQYFNGYGESLIDYNRHVNRLGVGFVLTDWL